MRSGFHVYRFPGVAVTLLTCAACTSEFSTSAVAPEVSVTLIGYNPVMARSSDQQVSAQIQDQASREVTNAKVKWTSSDPNVVGIVPDDELNVTVYALRPGLAAITVAVTGGVGSARLGEVRESVYVTERWNAVSAGARHTCGVTSDSIAYCWGAALLLGSGSAGRMAPGLVNGLSGLVQISAGENVTCGRQTGGVLFCWGTNDYGEVGNGSVSPQLFPTVGGGGFAGYVNVSVGRHHTCAVRGSYLYYCWGEKNFGELGPFPTPPDTVGCGVAGFFGPMRECVPTVFPISFPAFFTYDSIISSGGGYTCTNVACWGLATVGQLGDSAESGVFPQSCAATSVLSYSADQFPPSPAEISLPCWVYTDNGPPPPPPPPPPSSPLLRAGSLQFTAISAGWDSSFESHTCALVVDIPYCWGSNRHGELGIATSDPVPCQWTSAPASADPDILYPQGAPVCRRLPSVVEGGRTYFAIGAGAGYTCAIQSSDSAAYCWGDNSVGQLGDGARGSQRSVPAPVAGPSLRFTSLSVGVSHTCGISAADGALYCWGLGSDGQLGDGRSLMSDLPVRVLEPSGASVPSARRSTQRFTLGPASKSTTRSPWRP